MRFNDRNYLFIRQLNGSFEISGDLTIFEVQYFRNENRLFS
jgi:hypothetical protein